jgi:gas vesicle protein
MSDYSPEVNEKTVMANGSGKFLGGLLIGGVIGATIGILFAPRSGKETRQMLKASVSSIPELSELAENVQQQTQRTIEEAVQRLQEAIAVGQEASRRLRQEMTIATSAKEGED